MGPASGCAIGIVSTWSLFTELVGPGFASISTTSFQLPWRSIFEVLDALMVMPPRRTTACEPALRHAVIGVKELCRAEA